MGIGGGGDSSDTDLEAVLEASVKAVHGIHEIFDYFRRCNTSANTIFIVKALKLVSRKCSNFT